MSVSNPMAAGVVIAGQTRALAEVFLEKIDQQLLCVARYRPTGEVMSFAACALDDDVIWEAASGRARLASFTVLWQSYRANMAVPYNVAWVQLEEGPRLMSTVAGDGTRLRIGMALQARFTHAGLLTFTPSGSDVDAHDAAQRGILK